MSYYFIYVPVMTATVVLLVMMPQTWICVIPFATLLVFTALYRPYRETKENIRAIFNLMVIVAFL